jgi:hypothetical protein
MHRTCFTLLLLAGVLFPPGRTHACSIPVFRYALEQWHPDRYVVHVFHRGELTAEQRAQLDQLQPVGLNQQPIANLTVRTVDVAGELEPLAQELWDRHRSEALPWLVVETPSKPGLPVTHVWAGELSSAHVEQLIGSPLRASISKKLLEGESVVWVFLDSGNPERDDAAYKLLTEQLARLQQTLTLPPVDPADAAQLSIAPEGLKLSFSAVRVARDDPAEGPFVDMLLSVEPDLRSEPLIGREMAFPVFGRGRALYALVGDGINAGTIEEACQFLVGACQCTVKAQNPGADIVLAVDWDQFIDPAFSLETATPPLEGLSGSGASAAAKDAVAVLSPVAVPPGNPAEAVAAEIHVAPPPPPTVTATGSAVAPAVPVKLLALGLVIVGVVALAVALTTRRGA